MTSNLGNSMDSRAQKSGNVLLVTMITMLVAMGVLVNCLVFASNNARLTRLSIDREKAEIAAEAGLDYGIEALGSALKKYKMVTSMNAHALQAKLDLIDPPPPLGNYVYLTPDGARAFRIQVDSELMTGIVTNGSNFKGSQAVHQDFTIVCGCVNRDSKLGAVLKMKVQAVAIDFVRYGIFYEGDLEILPGPPMEFRGKVHSNSDIYLGGPLSFYEDLTAHGNIYHRRKDDGTRVPEAKIVNDSGTLISMKKGVGYVDCDYAKWPTESLVRWDDNVRSGVHGVPTLQPPLDPGTEPHFIIERPTPSSDPDYNPTDEQEKMSNKAGLRIFVDAAGKFSATNHAGVSVTATFSPATLLTNGVYSGSPLYAKDANGLYRFSVPGSYDVTQTAFRDRREGNVQMAPVDLYVDRLLAAYPQLVDGTLSAADGAGIVYVTRSDPDGPGGRMPCVRLRNGRLINAVDGVTFVSDLPVYVEGNYNSEAAKPSLVAGDAVTFLSSAWQDARSKEASVNTRMAQNTTYKTVVMTGNTDTAPGVRYNGGAENVLRFLENWTDRTVTYRGAIIDLWLSEIAISRWTYGNYYTAPNRDWGYDTTYLTRSPPGMPRAIGTEELLWSRTTWQAETW